MPLSVIEEHIRDQVAASPDRALTFAEAMALALYHPQHGYYGRGPLRIGRGGDFYTAVSVGPLYGRLIAEVAERTWGALGQPADFTLIEQGAHDGQLMEDVLRGLEAMQSPLAGQVRCLIIEANPAYRSAQSARLTPLLSSRLEWRDLPAALAEGPANAFFYTNELLDAFPVHRVCWTGSAWVEQKVALADDGTGFVWRDAPISDDRVKAEVDRLPTDLPAGYTTEVHPDAVDWVREIGRSAFRGTLLIADYGLEDHEYYTPERTDGTVRRYFEHKTDGNVLSNLGACDLTAHINFTRIIDEAQAGGFASLAMTDQGRFLTRLAASWLRRLEGAPPTAETAALLRQFHTLTHPSHMGMKFRICLLGRGVEVAV